jgi:hypothetical protein
MRTLRQDYASILLSSGYSVLLQVVVLAAIWICPLPIRNDRG